MPPNFRHWWRITRNGSNCIRIEYYHHKFVTNFENFKISYRNEGISQWSLLHQCNFCTWFVNLSWFFSFFFSSTSNGIQYEKPLLSGKSHYRPDTIFQFLHGYWSGSWWVDALCSTFSSEKGFFNQINVSLYWQIMSLISNYHQCNGEGTTNTNRH